MGVIIETYKNMVSSEQASENIGRRFKKVSDLVREGKLEEADREMYLMSHHPDMFIYWDSITQGRDKVPQVWTYVNTFNFRNDVATAYVNLVSGAMFVGSGFFKEHILAIDDQMFIVIHERNHMILNKLWWADLSRPMPNSRDKQRVPAKLPPIVKNFADDAYINAVGRKFILSTLPERYYDENKVHVLLTGKLSKVRGALENLLGISLAGKAPDHRSIYYGEWRNQSPEQLTANVMYAHDALYAYNEALLTKIGEGETPTVGRNRHYGQYVYWMQTFAAWYFGLPAAMRKKLDDALGAVPLVGQEAHDVKSAGPQQDGDLSAHSVKKPLGMSREEANQRLRELNELIAKRKQEAEDQKTRRREEEEAKHGPEAHPVDLEAPGNDDDGHGPGGGRTVSEGGDEDEGDRGHGPGAGRTVEEEPLPPTVGGSEDEESEDELSDEETGAMEGLKGERHGPAGFESDDEDVEAVDDEGGHVEFPPNPDDDGDWEESEDEDEDGGDDEAKRRIRQLASELGIDLDEIEGLEGSLELEPPPSSGNLPSIEHMERLNSWEAEQLGESLIRPIKATSYEFNDGDSWGFPRRLRNKESLGFDITKALAGKTTENVVWPQRINPINPDDFEIRLLMHTTEMDELDTPNSFSSGVFNQHNLGVASNLIGDIISQRSSDAVVHGQVVMPPSTLARRDMFWLSAGETPLLYTQELGVTRQKVVLYVDVSGSMHQYLPYVPYFVKRLSEYAGRTYHFSTVVAEADPQDNIVWGTGGTSFNQVGLHILDHGYKSVIVLTDGEDTLDSAIEEALKRQVEELYYLRVGFSAYGRITNRWHAFEDVATKIIPLFDHEPTEQEIEANTEE